MAFDAVTTLIKIVEQDLVDPTLLLIFDAGGMKVSLLKTIEFLSAKLCILQTFLEECDTKMNDGDTRCITTISFLHDAIRSRISSSYYENEIEYKLRRVYLAANVKGYVFEATQASEELHQTLKHVVRDIEHVEEWILAGKKRTALDPEKENITVWDTYQNALVPENEVTITMGFNSDIEMIINRLCYSHLMRSVFTILRNRNIHKFRKYVENLELKLQVIPLVGEGGIGKTTLAKRVYGHPITIASFDIRAWVVVSQVQNLKEMFIGLLHCISPITSEIYNLDNAQIAEQLCRSLMGKKYVILLDDIWTTAAWDAIQGCFPNNYNGSRILVTTRFEEVAKYLSGNPYNVHHQTPEDCMQLFSRKV
ncbi:PREDICTED: putative disease resistance RPP13-like protein 3 isoform X2 [Ipomoea nil]|nr:PREDICTED: putative disease resistance RPP13-like protein 3 isoform X2 [Ipomoea nil]